MTLTGRQWSVTARKAAAAALLVAAVAMLPGPVAANAAAAPALTRISGAGSTWSLGALDDWRSNVKSNYGMTVDYAPTGSTDGRNQFRNSSVDFAVSEIPYGLTDAGTGAFDSPPARKYAYMPIVAGGTSFMYNLQIGGHRVTNLRLSGELITKIFTGVITKWNDAAIKATNPGLALPDRRIVPVVRSDGSGTTAQFSAWMANQYPALWNAHCLRSGRKSPCGVTSYYPYPSGAGFVAKAQSLGVSAYVAQSNAEGAITYVESSYAQENGFPVAKVLNKAGYYVAPTRDNVAVALTKAQIETSDPNAANYLTQKLENVYNDTDKRTYPLSSYSYMIIPTQLESGLTENKGYTLGKFAYYFLCQGQQQVGDLGYSPLPINLVEAGFAQVRRIPGVVQEDIVTRSCNNPTFSTDGTNTLVKTAAYPSECDRQGATAQCGVAAGAGTANGGGTGNVGNTGGPTATPAPSQSAVVDPDTGEVGSGGSAAGGSASGGQAGYVDGIPVGLNDDQGWGIQHTLMVISAGLLLALICGPPLLSHRLRSRNSRRGK